MTITDEIAALQLATVPELAARYEAVFGAPPRTRNRAWLWKRIAWKLQEQALGGLSKRATAVLDQLVAEIKLPTAMPSAAAGSTVFLREWRGQKIRVESLPDGTFSWNGGTYKSLSAVAKAVTGAHWNGKLFFGVSKRRTA